ncbi:MAG: hypothetical protein MZU79_02690 [Anaerotruncus sp.]|nr:hypothetical protein [Anaerotruncus sp.]
MIDYLERRHDNQIAIHRGNAVELIDKPLMHLLNRWLEPGLTTYEARVKTTAKRFGAKRKVPIYIDSSTLFLPLRGIRAADALLVNFAAIVLATPMKNGLLKLGFASGITLIIRERLAFHRQEALAARILDEMVKSNN